MITKAEFYRDLEELLELAPGTLQDDTPLESVRFDSMAVVMFLAQADEKYGIGVSPSKVGEAKTAADLYSTLES